MQGGLQLHSDSVALVRLSQGGKVTRGRKRVHLWFSLVVLLVWKLDAPRPVGMRHVEVATGRCDEGDLLADRAGGPARATRGGQLRPELLPKETAERIGAGSSIPRVALLLPGVA